METQKTRRRSGRVKNPEFTRTTLLLNREIAEWAKHQPGGLSGIVRTLLDQARQRANRGEPDTMPPAEVTALAAEPLLREVWDTPEEDSAWAHL